MPGPRLAAEQGQPGPQLRYRVHVELVLGSDVHHAVIRRHVQAGPGGQRARELLGELVDVRQVVVPGVRGDTEHVPRPVQVAVVHGHVRAGVVGQDRGGLRREGPHAVGGPEVRAAHRRHGQAGAAERALSHVRGRDAGLGGPLVDRR